MKPKYKLQSIVRFLRNGKETQGKIVESTLFRAEGGVGYRIYPGRKEQPFYIGQEQITKVVFVPRFLHIG